MVDWGQALEVFAVGLSGVFLTLTGLMTAIVIFSKIMNVIGKMAGSKAEEVK